MALFDEIKKKVVDTTQNAVKATKEMAETARLNSLVSDEQRKIGNLYSQIGRLYHEKYGTGAESPFDELCKGIIEANEQIGKLQLEIQQVKGVKHCTNCGADIPIAAGFCNECGTAVETPVIQQEAMPSSAETRECSRCGAELENGAVFCSSCGQKHEL